MTATMIVGQAPFIKLANIYEDGPSYKPKYTKIKYGEVACTPKYANLPAHEKNNELINLHMIGWSLAFVFWI